VSQLRFFFYVPTLPPETGKALIISGTVYASDLTPLPGALVEIWQVDVGRVDYPHLPLIFGNNFHTDEAGHYELMTTKSIWSERSYLHYRVTYPDYCPLFIDLHLVLEPPSEPAEHIVAKVQITGPVLHGPVDIVLPVPSP
jgi:hypothetical protein